MVWKGTPNGDHLAPCLVVLIDEIDARAPRRAKGSDGSIGNREHQSRASDHNPDSRGVVRALDITDDPDNFDPDDFAEVLIARRDPRIKYLISDGRVCTSYDSTKGPAWTWRKYTGTNGHFAHLHISTLSSADNDRSTWFPQEDDEVNPIALVLLTYNAILGRNPESLEVINQSAESIRQAGDGGHSFVNAVANSDEAKMRHKAAKASGVDRVRSDAEILEVVRRALGGK